MRILAIADIHNDVENMLQFLEKASELNFDVVVCPGDFTDVAPKGFSQKDIGLLILEELKSLDKPVVAVPGNWDVDLIEIFEKDKISVHGKGRIIDGVGFYGFGGAKTPFGTAYEPGDEEIAAGIKKSYDEVKQAKVKVQVTHAPPLNTKLDLISSGAHVGSSAVRSFIEEKGPAAGVSAHIHEARGVEVIGNSKIVNPGRFPEGYCGIIDLSTKPIEAKVVSLI